MKIEMLSAFYAKGLFSALHEAFVNLSPDPG